MNIKNLIDYANYRSLYYYDWRYQEQMNEKDIEDFFDDFVDFYKRGDDVHHFHKNQIIQKARDFWAAENLIN